MKKYYNCPATEVITVNATYSICSESNPWQGPKPDTGSEIQY